MIEEFLQRLFNEDSDKDDEDQTGEFVISPEIVESIDKEERKHSKSKNDSDILLCDTSCEIEVCGEKKFVTFTNSASYAKKFQK